MAGDGLAERGGIDNAIVAYSQAVRAGRRLFVFGVCKMPKRTREQEYQRLWNSGQAATSERERTIEENRELQADLADLRNRFGIAFNNLVEQVHWLDSQPIETLAKFSDEVEVIAQKHNVGKRVNDAFWGAVWNLPKSGWEFHALGGMPKMHMTKELGFVLLITPETDIKNQLVIEFIEAWQKTMLYQHNSPPQPQKIDGSKQLNWKPVWEWAVRHPQITRKEIAQKIHRNYEHVKSKLEALDKQADNPLPFSFQK